MDKGKIVYKADYYDDESKKLHGLTVVLRDDEMKLQKILQATSATWREDTWLYYGETIFEIKDNEIFVTKDISGLEIREKPEVFQSNVVNVEAENIEDSKIYLEHLERTGLPMAESFLFTIKIFISVYCFYCCVFVYWFIR